MKRIIPVLITILLLVGCKKDEAQYRYFDDYTCEESGCYYIEGVVLEGQTMAPIEGVNMAFNYPTPTYAIDILATKVTNSDGYYSFEMPISFFHSSFHSIGLEIRDNGYVNGGRDVLIRFDSTDVNNTRQTDYVLYHASILKVIIHNSAETDFGSISIDCNYNLDNVSGEGIVMHDSPTFQSEIEFKVPSDLPTEFSWITYGGELESDGEMTITVKRGTTETVNIYL